MIKSFRSKPLEELFRAGKARKVAPDLQRRILRRLHVLNLATALRDLADPSFRCHPLKGEADRYALDVNGPWRVTFTWDGQDVHDVDLEQYH